MRPEFLIVPFSNHAQAEKNILDLEQRIAPTLMAPLASLLIHSPDPDTALSLFERYVEAAPPEALEALTRHPTALTYLVTIFAFSESLGETFLSDPSLAIQFARDRKFTRLKSAEELMQDYARYSVTSPDLWLSSQLARFKRRNHLRIALKDILGLSTLGETTLELSTLADVILKHALAYCGQELEKRYGRPQYQDADGRVTRAGFGVVSIGSLGGAELDYSPAIDLIFLYEGDGETSGGSESSSTIGNKEFFVRLAEAMTRAIGQVTPHGEVYSLDVDVRPDGEEGDAAISLNSALEYYDHRARDWELQMLIKARHSAGDPRLTREFVQGVESYVYRSRADTDAAKVKFAQREDDLNPQGESGDGAVNLKYHPGGIRDIEFLVQRLQRMHGGREPWVRSRGTLLALRKLNDKGLLSDPDFARLTSSYEFLRKVEHRIQLNEAEHRHRLPSGRQALERLARRAGIQAASSDGAGPALVSEVDRILSQVKRICERMIAVA